MKGSHHRLKKIFIIADAILLLLLIAFAIAVTLCRRGTADIETSDVGMPYIEYGGETYRERAELWTILLLGIDSEGEMKSSGSFENGSKCDFVSLLIIDEESLSYSLLHLNRDTMTDVPRLAIGGTAGTKVMQLALAYTYGDGMQNSCENTVAAIKDLLCGISIDDYFAVNMTGFEKLVDAVGGVEVTVRGDFSEIAPELVDGRLTQLDGELCLTYLRARRYVGGETNIERAERQRTFIGEIMPQLKDLDSGAIVLRETLDHVVTDMSAAQLSQVSELLAEGEFAGMYTPDGEVRDGGEYVEFYADEDALTELVIGLLFEPNASN